MFLRVVKWASDWRRIMVPTEPFPEPLITIVATSANIATRESWRPNRAADRHTLWGYSVVVIVAPFGLAFVLQQRLELA